MPATTQADTVFTGGAVYTADAAGRRVIPATAGVAARRRSAGHRGRRAR